MPIDGLVGIAVDGLALADPGIRDLRSILLGIAVDVASKLAYYFRRYTA
jgi:hypothetical protein